MSLHNPRAFKNQFPPLTPGTINAYLTSFLRELYLWSHIGAQLASNPPIPLIRTQPTRKDRQPAFFDATGPPPLFGPGGGGGGGSPAPPTTPTHSPASTDEYVYEHDPKTDQLTPDGRAAYDEAYLLYTKQEVKYEELSISLFTFIRDSIGEDSRILMSTKPNFQAIDASGDPLALFNLILSSHTTKTAESGFHDLTKFVNLTSDNLSMEAFIQELRACQKEVISAFGSVSHPDHISVHALTLAIFLRSLPSEFKWKVETLLGASDLRDIDPQQTIADLLAYKVRLESQGHYVAPSAVGEALATEQKRPGTTPTDPTPFKPSKATNTYSDGSTGPINLSNIGDGPPAAYCHHCYQRFGLFRNNHTSAVCSQKVTVLPRDARPLPTAAQLRSQAAHKTKPGSARKQALACEKQLQWLQEEEEEATK